MAIGSGSAYVEGRNTYPSICDISHLTGIILCHGPRPAAARHTPSRRPATTRSSVERRIWRKIWDDVWSQLTVCLCARSASIRDSPVFSECSMCSPHGVCARGAGGVSCVRSDVHSYIPSGNCHNGIWDSPLSLPSFWNLVPTLGNSSRHFFTNRRVSPSAGGGPSDTEILEFDP